MNEILLNKSSEKIILLGNETIVRGAIEAGVQFVSTYPGTPASEIGNIFYNFKSQISKLVPNFYFEFSTNEKVALEAGMGASFSGLKTLVAMKHFGLNVCQDALLPFVNAGCVGPTVIIVADDPSCHSSAQSEQDSRAISYLAHIPTLEPCNPQECKDFTKLGFELSAKFKIPIMIRTTTRVAHQRMPVKFNEIPVPGSAFNAKFVKDPKKFITMPARALEMKKELLQKIEKIRAFSEKSEINLWKTSQGRALRRVQGRALRSQGIIVSGVSYLYVQEALKELNISLPVLKLGFFYPLPEQKIKKFIKNLEKVLIIEELDPWLEKGVAILAKDVNPKLKIQGKDLLPVVGEFTPDLVVNAVAGFTNKRIKFQIANPELPIVKRFPRLCTNCPYWLVFGAVKQALKQGKIEEKDVIFGGDIGCYMLAGMAPINLQDYIFCMGASIGIGHGIKKSTNQKLIAFIGDSTFFHAGIPALINTVVNKSNPLIIIMDNKTTAMTGHQPHPGQTINIETLVKACGVENVKTINPINQKLMVDTIKQYLKQKQVSVIIASMPCIFVK